MHEFDTRYNSKNEIVKYAYFEHLEHVEGKSPKTINQYILAIHEFEVALNFESFKEYRKDSAILFKQYLNDKKNKINGENISKSLYFHYVDHVRHFFAWLNENMPEYKKIKKDQIAYLRVSKNDANCAKARDFPNSHSTQDILATIRNMPNSTLIEIRNKAIMSLLILTTPRISALQTASIDSIRYFKEYDVWAFIQSPNKQNTKFAKSITAFFIGNSQDIIENVINWRNYLISNGAKENDCLFPRIDNRYNKQRQLEHSITSFPIQSATGIRELSKKSFNRNGLEHIKIHNFRHSITREATKKNSIDLMIALSENMGHKNTMSTLVASYGGNPLAQQARLMKSLSLE